MYRCLRYNAKIKSTKGGAVINDMLIGIHPVVWQATNPEAYGWAEVTEGTADGVIGIYTAQGGDISNFLFGVVLMNQVKIDSGVVALSPSADADELINPRSNFAYTNAAVGSGEIPLLKANGDVMQINSGKATAAAVNGGVVFEVDVSFSFSTEKGHTVEIKSFDEWEETVRRSFNTLADTSIGPPLFGWDDWVRNTVARRAQSLLNTNSFGPKRTTAAELSQIGLQQNIPFAIEANTLGHVPRFSRDSSIFRHLRYSSYSRMHAAFGLAQPVECPVWIQYIWPRINNVPFLADSAYFEQAVRFAVQCYGNNLTLKQFVSDPLSYPDIFCMSCGFLGLSMPYVTDTDQTGRQTDEMIHPASGPCPGRMGGDCEDTSIAWMDMAARLHTAAKEYLVREGFRPAATPVEALLWIAYFYIAMMCDTSAVSWNTRSADGVSALPSRFRLSEEECRTAAENDSSEWTEPFDNKTLHITGRMFPITLLAEVMTDAQSQRVTGERPLDGTRGRSPFVDVGEYLNNLIRQVPAKVTKSMTEKCKDILVYESTDGYLPTANVSDTLVHDLERQCLRGAKNARLLHDTAFFAKTRFVHRVLRLYSTTLFQEVGITGLIGVDNCSGNPAIGIHGAGSQSHSYVRSHCCIYPLPTPSPLELESAFNYWKLAPWPNTIRLEQVTLQDTADPWRLDGDKQRTPVFALYAPDKIKSRIESSSEFKLVSEVPLEVPVTMFRSIFVFLVERKY